MEERAVERREIPLPAVLQTHLVAPGSEPVGCVSDEEAEPAHPDDDQVQFVNPGPSVSHVDLGWSRDTLKQSLFITFMFWGWENSDLGLILICPGVKQFDRAKVALSL